jgi:broad specificity phosphatase PhoE
MNDQFQTVIFLIRHGETDGYYSHDPQSDDKRHLTERGKEQMRLVGEYLKDFAPAAIYSSPRRRTVECSQIIKATAQIESQIVEAKELMEVYTNEQYLSLSQRVPQFFREIVRAHPGRHIVCLTHQDVIQGALDSYDLTSQEKSFPCWMGEGYRLVFAGDILVECNKILAAHAS